MEHIYLLIVGCGRIGQMHVDNILQDFPEVKITAVVDSKLDPQWAEERGLKVLEKTDLNAALADDKLHAVLIAASSSDHVNLIEAAATAGKHIFCEKPISFSPELIDQVIAITKKHRVKLQVGLNRRFDPEFLKVKETVDAGVIGDLHIIKITNRDPKRPDPAFIPRSGGLFLDFNVHDFDMARFISDAEFEDVYAMGANLVDPQIGELGDIDTAIITAKLSNGALCIIDSSRETHYGYDQKLEVFGSKGSVTANNTQPTHTVLSTEASVQVEKPHYSFVERYQEAYRRQFFDFFRAIKQDTATPVTAEDMKQAVMVGQAAKKSFEENQPIQLITQPVVETA